MRVQKVAGDRVGTAGRGQCVELGSRSRAGRTENKRGPGCQALSVIRTIPAPAGELGGRPGGIRTCDQRIKAGTWGFVADKRTHQAQGNKTLTRTPPQMPALVRSSDQVQTYVKAPLRSRRLLYQLQQTSPRTPHFPCAFWRYGNRFAVRRAHLRPCACPVQRCGPSLQGLLFDELRATRDFGIFFRSSGPVRTRT